MVNTTLALMIAGGGAVLVWTGITDPEGGITGAFGSVLRGDAKITGKAKRAGTGAEGLARFTPALFVPAAASPAAGTSSAGTGSSSAPAASGTGAAVVAVAMAQLGTPYRWGQEEPGGFDCSGLALYAFQQGAGVTLPRTAAQQALRGKAVALDALAPGDMVFWGVPASHCAIAIGGGKVVHAPSTGDVVKTSSIWSRGTAYGRRILSTTGTISA